MKENPFINTSIWPSCSKKKDFFFFFFFKEAAVVGINIFGFLGGLLSRDRQYAVSVLGGDLPLICQPLHQNMLNN